MKLRLVTALAGATLLSACGLNSVPTAEEAAKARWADVQNDYQRRADLIPNLVATVKAAGAQEKSILVEVTQARAAANNIRVSASDLSDPAKLAQFDRAQSAVSMSLQRLQEAYPDLKSQGNYATLLSQLEGTENRITVARNRYVQTVAEYNVKARSFPTNLTAMMFGYKVKPNFTVQNEAQISVPPTVNFDKTPSAPR